MLRVYLSKNVFELGAAPNWKGSGTFCRPKERERLSQGKEDRGKALFEAHVAACDWLSLGFCFPNLEVFTGSGFLN